MNRSTGTAGRELTGRKVLMLLLAFFGTVFAADFALIYGALSTFPGVVVEDSYVASQEWNERTAAQQALGWKARIAYAPGELEVVMTGSDGAPVPGLSVSVVVGRPGSQAEDRRLDLTPSADGYRAPVELAPGRWRVELVATDRDGRDFRAFSEFIVRGGG